MTDVLLINPQPVVLKDNYASTVMIANPPLGLAYIAGALRASGYSAKIDDIGVSGHSLNELKELIEDDSIWAVGISSGITNHCNGMRTARFLRECFPGLLIIMGGPQATYIYSEILACGDVDAVVRLEGEITMPLILKAWQSGRPLSDIDGLAVRLKDGTIHCTKLRSPIDDLDSIDYPAWDLLAIEKYQQPGIILTGRGCPYHCIFCSAGAMSKGRYRMRSANNVVNEIEYLYKNFGIRHFFFADDTFTANEDHCISICREIRSRGLDIKWEAEARADTVTEQIAQEMVKAGCMHVQIGAESGDNTILKTIGKKITSEMIERAVKIFLSNGITVVCSYILVNHEDTPETVERTINFAIKLKNIAPRFSSSKFSFLTPIPGTPVYDKRDRLGIRLLSDNWDKYTFLDCVCETKNFDKRAIQNTFLRAWASYVRGELIPEGAKYEAV